MLAGQTNDTLTLTNVQTADAGDYFVVVSNSVGTITSRVARLTLGSPDTDGDGIPDDWEQIFGLNPNLNDANQDIDLDGLTNLQEYQVGTNPTNAASVLKFESPALAGDLTNLTLRFNAVSNKSYTIEYRNKVTAGLPWQQWLAIEAVPSNRLVELTNAVSTNEQRIFRLGVPKQ